jgi:hypothetical protein
MAIGRQKHVVVPLDDSYRPSPCAPIMLGVVIAVLLGCGRPHGWDYTAVSPKETDLVGTYKVTRYNGEIDSIEGFSRRNSIQVVLNADHTTRVSEFPQFDGFGDFVICKLSESGTWEFGRGPGAEIRFKFKSVPKSKDDSRHGRECSGDFEIPLLGHRPPYSLYLSIGDPDSDTGIELQRVAD